MRRSSSYVSYVRASHGDACRRPSVVRPSGLICVAVFVSQEEVDFGYGTKAERWGGTILDDSDDDDTEHGGLPPGTEVRRSEESGPEGAPRSRVGVGVTGIMAGYYFM